MSDQDEIGDPNIIQTLEDHERKLGLPHGFLISLVAKGEDWAFIVTLSALAETALNELLLKAFNRPEIESQLAPLRMAVKVEMAKRMKVIEPADAKFLDRLTFIRNRLAHNVRRIAAFDLHTHFEQEPKDRALLDDYNVDVPREQRRSLRVQLLTLTLLVLLSLELAEQLIEIEQQKGEEAALQLRILERDALLRLMADRPAARSTSPTFTSSKMSDFAHPSED